MKKKTTGPLTGTEKIKILDLYAKKMTQKDIAKEIGRSIPTVARCIREMQEVTLKAFKGDTKDLPENYSIEPKNYLDTDIYSRVTERLILAGIKADYARKRIAKVCANAVVNDVASITEEDLFEASMQTVSASEIFQQETGRGQKGVTVLTETASQHGDSATQQFSGRSAKPNGVTTFPTGA